MVRIFILKVLLRVFLLCDWVVYIFVLIFSFKFFIVRFLRIKNLFFWEELFFILGFVIFELVVVVGVEEVGVFVLFELVLIVVVCFWVVVIVGVDEIVGFVGVVILVGFFIVFFCNWLISLIVMNLELWSFCCVVMYDCLFLKFVNV